MSVHKRLAIMVVMFFFISAQIPFSSGQEVSVISGRVMDARTSLPIQNATIVILDPVGTKIITSTDSLGFFTTEVSRTNWYSVYALCDRDETPGMDYVPSQWRIYLGIGSQAAFTFFLEPGASLFLEGDIWFVESPKPATQFWFQVLSLSGQPWGGVYSVNRYGTAEKYSARVYTGFWEHRALGLDERLVVVPAEREVIVEVHATVDAITHEFMVDGKAGFIELAQGESLNVDVREYCLTFNRAQINESIESASSLLKRAEDAGFLVTAEHEDLLKTVRFVNASTTAMEGGLYDESFAELRAAYFLVEEMINRLEGMFRSGSQTALTLTFFFVFVAQAIASLVTEARTVEIRSKLIPLRLSRFSHLQYAFSRILRSLPWMPRRSSDSLRFDCCLCAAHRSNGHGIAA